MRSDLCAGEDARPDRSARQKVLVLSMADHTPSLPKRILVPIDFSPHADRAFAYARELAVKLQAELHVVHVYQAPMYALPEGVAFAGPELETELSHAAQRQLDAWLQSKGSEAPQVKGLLRKGVPSDEIVRGAVDTNAGLIVMGTHGRTGVTRFLLGSVAERVVRTSEVPVLTLPLAS